MVVARSDMDAGRALVVEKECFQLYQSLKEATPGLVDILLGSETRIKSRLGSAEMSMWASIVAADGHMDAGSGKVEHLCSGCQVIVYACAFVSSFLCSFRLRCKTCSTKLPTIRVCVLGLGDAIQALMLHLFALAATTRRRFSICIRKLDLYFARPDYTEALVCFSLL